MTTENANEWTCNLIDPCFVQKRSSKQLGIKINGLSLLKDKTNRLPRPTIMKIRHLLLMLLFLTAKLEAQFVFVPDSNFRKFIKQNISIVAIKGDSLDTTNVYVVSQKYLYLSWNSTTPINLDGIQYFDSLNSFNIGALNVNSVLKLPPLLKSLGLNGSTINSISSPGNSLEQLSLTNGRIIDVSSIPKSLKLFRADNSIIDLSLLPDSVLSITVYNDTTLTFIHHLPPQIKTLFIELLALYLLYLLLL